MTRKAFVISDTSERTIEANILSDIFHYIRSNSKRQVTIISPTQNQELELGFDATFYGLPKGFTIFLQFKRPYPYYSKKNANFARFIIDTHQLKTLLGNFNQSEAFFVFVPLPTVREVIANRSALLQIGSALDIYDVPRRAKITQRTRTVRVSKSALVPSIQVADPRKFDPAENAKTLKSLCMALDEGRIGIEGSKGADIKDVPRDKRRIVLRSRGLFFIHVTSAQER